jgi:hypothetical protein
MGLRPLRADSSLATDINKLYGDIVDGGGG